MDVDSATSWDDHCLQDFRQSLEFGVGHPEKDHTWTCWADKIAEIHEFAQEIQMVGEVALTTLPFSMVSR